MQEKVSIMCSWCGWKYPSNGLRAARRWRGYASLRPRGGFLHPHQEHMKDTYSLNQPIFKLRIICIVCLVFYEKNVLYVILFSVYLVNTYLITQNNVLTLNSYTKLFFNFFLSIAGSLFLIITYFSRPFTKFYSGPRT